MAGEKPNGADQDAGDIRSALAAAIATHEEPEAEVEPKAPAEKTAAEPEKTATEEPAAKEPVRGPDSKFTKAADGDKEQKEPEKAAAEKTEGKTGPEKTAEEKAAETVAASKEPPATWPASAREMFKTLPEPAQAFLLKRERDMVADYTKKTEAISHLKREYEPVAKMFEPYADVLRQKGMTPSKVIQAWANVETDLAAGGEKAINIVRGLISGYNIDPGKLAQAIGLQPKAAADTREAPPEPEGGEKIQLPPAVMAELQALRDKVGGFEQTLTTQQQRQQQIAQAAQAANEAAAQAKVDHFRNETDGKGNVLHPFFDEVEGIMTALAQRAIQMRQPVPDLKELYENAVRANPATFEALSTAQKRAADEREREAARAKAADARKAAASVTGSPGTGPAPSQARRDLSLREEIEANLAEVESAG